MEPGPHERVEDIVGKLAGLVDLGRSWRDLVVGESADRLAEHLVLVGKPINVELGISQHHDSDSRTTDYLVSVGWVDSIPSRDWRMHKVVHHRGAAPHVLPRAWVPSPVTRREAP